LFQSREGEFIINFQIIEAKRGPSIFLVSTPKGILTTKEAKKVGMGGEIIAEIW